MGEAATVQATVRFERKREAILDAATALLNRRGVKGLTLGLAAQAVDLSTTSVTYYFRRKDDLAAAVMLRGLAELSVIVCCALGEPTPGARLRALLALYVERMRRAGAGEAAPLPMLSEIRALNMPQRAEVAQAYTRLFRRLRTLFEGPDLTGLSRNRRTARTHMLLEQLAWGCAWLPAYGPADYARLGAQIDDVLEGGLAARGGAWSPRPIRLAELAPGARPETGRDIFLVAATRLINSCGYRGASVERISAELHVTKGSFYHHNDAKDDLVAACFARTFEVTERALRLAGQVEGDGWTRLCSAAAALAEYQVCEHGPLLRISAMTALPDALRQEIAVQARGVLERFAGMIAAGVADGSVRPVDPTVAAHLLNTALGAGAELDPAVPAFAHSAAPSAFVRPLLTGLFSH
jgi:AcrR family transcriptional regulator